MFLSFFTYGYPGDSLGYLFYIKEWILKTLPAEGYLRGIFVTNIPQQTILSIFLYTPSILFGAVGGYNLILVLTFILNFLSAFFVGVWLIKSKAASMVMAVIFSSSLYVQWHAYQNIELATVFWLPVLVFFLFKFIREGSLSASLKISFISAGVFMTSFYLGFFSLILIFGSVLAAFIYKLIFYKKVRIRIFVSSLIFLILFLVFTLPSTFKLISFFSKPNEWGIYSQKYIFRSNQEDLIAYGARPWDYIAPSIYHPVLGSMVKNFYKFVKENYSYQFWSTFLPERINYLTLTGISLAFYSIWVGLKSWRRKQNLITQDDLKIISFLVFVAFLMFLVSMPAIIKLKDFIAYFPSYFLFKIFPMFRVYARAGVFVLLATSILAGYGLKFLLGKISNDWFVLKFGRIYFSGRKSVVLTSVLCGLVLFENLNFPPFPLMDVGRLPMVYAWLKNQSGNLVVAEYPRDNSIVDIGGGCPNWLDPKITRDYNWAYTTFYQTRHGKKTIDFEKLPKIERQAAADLSLADSYKILQKYHVNYVLVHTKEPMIGIHPWPYAQENPLDDCWQRRIMKKPDKVYPGFKQVVEFDDGVVYSVQ